MIKAHASEYTNHSGGCPGADIEWDRIGREFGVVHHNHYRPADLKKLPVEWHAKMLSEVKSAAEVLGRPYNFKGVELVQRNWFQAEYTQAIFAVARIIEPVAWDKGFQNNSGKQIVGGGTGWAVEMAIQKEKPVFVFDTLSTEWYKWESGMFVITETPILTLDFAGIGTRLLTNRGWKAIREVYEKTFQ